MLADGPPCSTEDCDNPATEIHATAGDCCVAGLTAGDVEPTCEEHHLSSGCLDPRDTAEARRIKRIVDAAESGNVW